MHVPTADEKQAGEPNILKICDFGISLALDERDSEDNLIKALMVERSGTAGYIAPEIKGSKELVSPAIDMWGFGVILYELSVAYKPTAIKPDRKNFYRYNTGPIPFNDRNWKHLSHKGKHVQDLIL
jgi:serine/threonine protein kinase